MWDVDGMLEEMSWDQLQGWMEFADAEPFGYMREDVMTGMVCAVLANVHRDTKHKRKPYGPMDFTPFLDTPAVSERQPLTDPEQWRQLRETLVEAVTGA